MSTRPRRTRLTRLLLTAGLGLASAGLAVVTAGAPANATGLCDRWVATDGSDANAGTEAAPYRSVGKLVTNLQAGQVGCFPANQTYYSANAVGDGGYAQAHTGGGTALAPVTLTSGPGGPAVFAGQLLLGVATHDITLTGIHFTGKRYATGGAFGYKGVHLILNGDRIRVEHNDITDPTGICIQLGDSNQVDPAVGTVVTQNRIHGCGMDPDIAWVPTDSGAHGIYVQHTEGAEISENLIYRNRTRGVQFYPRNDGVQVHHNLFFRNATQVNVGSEGADVSQHSDVYANVMADRVKDWAPAKNESQVFGNMPAVGEFDNQVSGNCYDPGDVFTAGNGLDVQPDNVAGVPTFTDATHDDFTLTSDSACQGMGPAEIQPAGFTMDDESVTEATGDDVIMTFSWNQLLHADAVLVAGSAGVEDYELLDSHLGDLGEQSARVRIIGDAVDEPTETFTFELRNTDNPDEVYGTATGTILDDDAPAGVRPDAEIRPAGGTFVGDGVYNTMGADQSVAVTVAQGRTTSLDLRLGNDGSASDDLTAALSPSGGHSGFVDTWASGATDVTGAVHGGDLNLTDVPSGGTRLLTARIKPTAGAAVGSSVTYYLHLYHSPIGEAPVKDVVAVRVTVGPPVLRPDAMVRAGSGPLVGSNVYSATGAGQLVESRTAPGRSATFKVTIGNDGSVARRLTLKGSAPIGALRGTWRRGSADVTDAVRAGTLRTPLLQPGATWTVVLVVKAARSARVGAVATAQLTARDGSRVDQVRMRTTVAR